MMYVTHLAFAALVFILLSKYIQESMYVALGVCLLASLLPDIDRHESKIGKKFPITSKVVESVFSHRGVVHSLLVAAILFLLIYILLDYYSQNIFYAYAFLIGYISHLAIDSLNPKGIAWLHPFSKKRVSGFIPTNGLGEKAVLIAVFLAIITFAVKGAQYIHKP